MPKKREYFQELIEKRGDEVAMSTKDCVVWKSEHSNCADCPSELGCGKLVKMQLTMLMPLMYEPKSFEDFQKMSKRIDELTHSILDAKTPEELRAIFVE